MIFWANVMREQLQEIDELYETSRALCAAFVKRWDDQPRRKIAQVERAKLIHAAYAAMRAAADSAESQSWSALESEWRALFNKLRNSVNALVVYAEAFAVRNLCLSDTQTRRGHALAGGGWTHGVCVTHRECSFVCLCAGCTGSWRACCAVAPITASKQHTVSAISHDRSWI